MEWSARTGLRRHLGLLVSGGLVLLIGSLGLVAGHTAGRQAREVHREDRLALQLRLAGLVDQYAQLAAAEVLDAATDGGPWGTRSDPATTTRLRSVVEGTRALDVGAVLVDPTGQPLAAWSTTGVLPDRDDPGWGPLRAAVRERAGGLPVSGVLRAGDRSLLALGVPVDLVGGGRGLLVGLWDPVRGALQSYVSQLSHGKTGRGYVLDARGLVVAGPTPEEVGAPLQLEQLREAVRRGHHGIVETEDSGVPLVSSFAVADRTGWTAITPQAREEFEGALVRSSRLVEAAVVALLLIAGTGLVVLHRKREAALEAVALRDELTGLYNRRGWFALAEHELERARRQGTGRVLLFVDVDGLKQVNDTLGHREGDRAIADAARVLTAASRACDLVGRLGGDEFVLLLDRAGGEPARRRLLAALEAHNAGSGAAFELRLSVGGAVRFPEQASTLDELVRRADQEMYLDKASRPARAEGVVRIPAPRPAPDAVVRP